MLVRNRCKVVVMRVDSSGHHCWKCSNGAIELNQRGSYFQRGRSTTLKSNTLAGWLSIQSRQTFAHNEIFVHASCKKVFTNLADAQAWLSCYPNSHDVTLKDSLDGKLSILAAGCFSRKSIARGPFTTSSVTMRRPLPSVNKRNV